MQSARLTYENIKQEHSLLLFSLFTNNKIREYLGGVLSDVLARERVDAMVAHPPAHHWVIKSNGGDYIGNVSLTGYYDGVSTEISYALLPEFWGKGYASEAIQWVLKNTENERLLAETQLKNLASIELLKKLNFSQIGQIERFGQQQAIYQLNLLDSVGKKT